MIKFIKKLAKNKKGSEVVEKIFMIVVSVGIAAFAAGWIYKVVNDASSKTEPGYTPTTSAQNPIPSGA